MCKIYEYFHCCNHSYQVRISTCLGAFVTPNTQHLKEGRQRKCHQQPSIEITLPTLCGACVYALEQADYSSARNAIVQEMWQLHQCRGPMEKMVDAQQKLNELEAVPRQTSSSFPFRPVRVERRRLADKARCRGSSLKNEISAESIEAPWSFGEEDTTAEVEGKWTEAESGSRKKCVAWESSWEADDVVLR